MLRRTFLKSIGTAACVLPFRQVCSAAETTRSPNIIFIVADDWGYGDLGIHDSTFCRTPNLDRLAREGIDFQNFTVNSPVCSPSRAAVMTGHFPARYSVHQHFAGVASNEKRGMPDWLDPKAVQLPQFGIRKCPESAPGYHLQAKAGAPHSQAALRDGIPAAKHL